MLKTLFRALSWRTISIAALASGAAFLAAQQVLAGPITNPGSAPFVKLAAYQGVISIVPASGAAAMELGNNGRDIATSGDLVLRPGALSDTDATSYIRTYKNGSNKGSVRVSGDICFGPTDNADCRSTWAGIGGSSSLDQILAVGNKSNNSIVLGQGTGTAAGLAYIDVQESVVAPSTRDAISTKVATGSNSKSAIYAENGSGSGWAGYFSGRVNITGTLVVQGRTKPLAVQVCQIGTDTCLGRYLYSSGTTRDTTASGVKFFYENAGAIANVAAYAQTSSSYSCTGAPTHVVVDRSGGGLSYWSLAGCGGAEYVDQAGTPFGNGKTCKDTVTVYAFSAYRTTNCSSTTIQSQLRRINDAELITTPVYSQDYELR